MASHSGGTEDSEQIQEIADVKLLQDYVVKLITLVLEENKLPSTTLIKKLSEPASVELMKKFIGEPQTRSLMVEKVTIKGKDSYYILISILLSVLKNANKILHSLIM